MSVLEPVWTPRATHLYVLQGPTLNQFTPRSPSSPLPPINHPENYLWETAYLTFRVFLSPWTHSDTDPRLLEKQEQQQPTYVALSYINR